MESLSPPSPPNQRWGNGAFWLLRDFILDLGGGGGGGDGGLLFHFISKTFSFPELRSFWSAGSIPAADQKDRSSGNENVSKIVSPRLWSKIPSKDRLAASLIL